MVQMILFAKQKQTHVENKCMDTKWDGMNWETGIDVHTLLILCIKQMTDENLLYRLMNPTQCSVVT